MTGAQSIKYQGDMQLNMANTTGKECTIVIKDVYYNPSLSYNLVSVSDLTNNDYTSSFARHGATLHAPAGIFDLIKTSNVYLFPVNPKDDQGLGAFFWTHGRRAHVLSTESHCQSSENGDPVKIRGKGYQTRLVGDQIQIQHMPTCQYSQAGLSSCRYRFKPTRHHIRPRRHVKNQDHI